MVRIVAVLPCDVGASLPGTKLFLQEPQKIAQPLGPLYWGLLLANEPVRSGTVGSDRRAAITRF
jgi:hypothetical protein